MTAAEAALIRLKLVALESYLQELRAYVEVDAATYLTRPELRRAPERMIQVLVECTIDAAETIAEAAARPPPPTGRAAFGELHSLGALDEELANLFGRRYVGLRNRLLHDYEQIDNARVQQSGRSLLEHARLFARRVSGWVDQQGIDGSPPC